MPFRLRLLSPSEHVGLWGCVLTAGVAVAMMFSEPGYGAVALIFGGGGATTMLFHARSLDDDEVVNPIAAFRYRTARHDLPGYRDLLTRLAELNERQAGRALAHLTRPHGGDGLLEGLFFHARRGELTAELRPFVERLRDRPTPLVAALASLCGDGHVREAAVSVMASRPRPELVPFLVVRAVDWVEPVQERALAALREILPGGRPQMEQWYRRVAAQRRAWRLAGLLGLQAEHVR